MEDSQRNCKRRDEISAVGSPTFSSPKKIKMQIDFAFDESNLPSQRLLQDQLSSALSPDNQISPVMSSNSGEFLSGDICSGESIACRIDSSLLPTDSLRVVDLEAKSFETESSTCIDNKFSRETTPSSKFHDEMDSTAPGKKSCDGGENEKLQAEEERKKTTVYDSIEQFLAEAEKEMKEKQKRFQEKYNYDIENDVPLEGRYEWVRLKP